MVRFLRGTTVPVLLIGMLVMAGVTADRVYSGDVLTMLVAGAAAGSILISLLLSRTPAWLIAPLSTLGLAGYLAFALIYTAQRGQITGGLTTIAVDSLRDGVPRLLAALVPIEPQPDTIAVPVVATWITGLAAAELAIRFRRTMVGLVPPVVLYAGALWLVGPSAPSTLWHTLLFGAIVVAALAITGRVRTPDTGIDSATRNALRLRTAVAAGTGVVLILALGIAGGPLLSERITKRPLDPRSLVEPPQLDALDENPLIRLSGWALQPDQRLFEATVDRDTRVRLAVLSDYDGVTWRVGATYRPAGRSLPELPSEVPREPIRQTIRVAELRGKLLPTIATARQVDGIRVSFDQATGTVIRPEGLVPGLSYTVTSYVDQPDGALLPAAEVPDANTMARYLALGSGIPEDMQLLAQTLGESNGAPYARAQAIEQYLSEHFKLDPQAPSGHAYPNLEFFLFKPPTHGGQKGTSEQFAATYAVLARLLNLPSRIAVGFHTPAGTRFVTAGDAFAWPEVYFQGIGWVPFNPLPQSDTPRPPEEQFKPQPEDSEEPPPPSEAPVPTLEPTMAAPAPEAAAPPLAAGPDIVLVAGAGGGGLVLLTLLGFILVVLIGRSRLRRRRLYAGPSGSRVEGAWLELSDALRLAGRPAPDYLTAQEVSSHAAVAAPTRLDELAEAVNRTSFAPDTADETQAGLARSSVLAYIHELKARRSWWKRLIWTLHPGPLRWRR